MDEGPQESSGTQEPRSASSEDDFEPVVLRALAAQVAFLRTELARVWGAVDDRDRTIAELREVIRTRDEQLRDTDEEMRRREKYIRHLTRWHRLVPGPVRAAIRRRRAR